LFLTQREYNLVLESIDNREKEKTYLRGKIQKLICELGTPELLRQETERIGALQAKINGLDIINNRWEYQVVHGLRANLSDIIIKINSLKQRGLDEDRKFVNRIGDLFTKELESMEGKDIATHQ
jgi:hypothetical protein